MSLRFEWDDDKATANVRKHGISFQEATEVFADPLALTVLDDEHSDSEDRYHTIGMSQRLRVLLVVHVERRDTVRLISARRATRLERYAYENRHD